MKNVRTIDQVARLLGGALLLELGYFWLGGSARWVAFLLAAVLLLTATLRYCPVYRFLGIEPVPVNRAAIGKVWMAVFSVAFLGTLIGGSYASALLSRKWFLEDFNAMNHFYKQTLFLTGKNERVAANTNYDLWRPAFASFRDKYAQYRPVALRGDAMFDEDLQTVDAMLTQVEPSVRTGDLHQAHLDLEKVRPVFQEMFKRNGFSLLAVALVDFHDVMEVVLDAAAAKDAGKITSAYAVANDKLKAVEAEANDEEIQLIRKNLDDLLALARGGNADGLKASADALKTSFVKVYLKRG